MNKVTIELARTKSLQGYGTLGLAPWTNMGEDTLDKLVEWSSLPENKNKKIVKHVVHCRIEPRDIKEYHYAAECGGLTQEDCAKLFADRLNDTSPRHRFETADSIVFCSSMVYRVPYIDNVYTVDIYWETI